MENAGKLNIYICEYDDTNMFVVVKSGVLNGENGYIFSKNIVIEDIKMEIERFVVHNIL